jgi:divalent metal cation (Fe/Co/Zn/Cd) transporter
MRATAADSISDALSTTAVLIGAVVRLFFPDSIVSLYIDAVIGAFVSIFIIVAGAKILNETKNLILGEPPTKEEVDKIEEIVRSYPEVLGIHDMMLHRYGPCNAVASLHVEVDGSKNMFDIHDTIDNIELQVLRDTGVVCTIHTDPIQLDADVTALRERVASLVGEIDGGMTIHDFRVVFGTTHSNLLFDIAVPFETKLTDAAVVAAVSEKVKTIDENYFVVVHIDRV